jgi:hypothetical protein
VIEEPIGKAKKPHEYKILTLGKETGDTDEASRQINAAIKDGFILRDLFISDGIRVILERSN